MKKTIFLIAMLGGMLSLASCKKAYNCRCNTTFVFPDGSTNTFVSVTTPMNKKMREKQATAVCTSEASNIDKTYYNFDTNNGAGQQSNVSYKTTCTLQ